MNIKNRLKNLEAETGVNSEYCECFPQGDEYWQQTITDDGLSYTEPVLMGEPSPDVCDTCPKPRIKRRVIICFGSLEHPLQEPPAEALL